MTILVPELNLPNAYWGKTKPKGNGGVPEEISGDFLKIMFHMASASLPEKSEREISELLD